MRQSSEQGAMLEMESHSDGIRLTLDARDESDRYINEAIGTATLIYPDLSKTEWKLHQTAPGRYEAEISLETMSMGNVPSVYHLQTELKLGGSLSENKVWDRQSRSIIARYSDELRIRPTNERLLHQLATLTGGSYQIAAEEIAHWQTGRRAFQTLPLWSWLLSLAALFYVFDVLLRRIELL
jgi:hypothetical protein